MTELKPCPFCGSEARFTCWINPYKDRYGVTCISDDCGVSIFAGLTKEEAAKRWNRRVGRMQWISKLVRAGFEALGAGKRAPHGANRR